MNRRRAFIASGQTLGAACPICGRFMDGYTGANLENDGKPPVPAAGDPTVCLYCASLLVFTDADGGLRVASPAERQALFADSEVGPLMREFLRFAVESIAASGVRH